MINPVGWLTAAVGPASRGLDAVKGLPGSLLGVGELSRQVEDLREDVQALGVMPASIDRLGEDTAELPRVRAELQAVAEATTAMQRHTASMERHTASIAETVPALVSLEQSLPALVPVLQTTSETLAQLQVTLVDLERSVQRLSRLAPRWPGRRNASTTE
jgi:uncharacterized protein involved in exopolysaccharide biosynthesis